MKFFIGQRVVLARPERLMHMKGELGTVEGVNPCDGDIVVLYDISGKKESHPRQLDPLNDGDNIVEWDSCAWIPEDIKINA